MSPIKGLTEKRRLPRLGKIHLGIMVTKNKQGKECAPYPRATNYFVFDPTNPLYDELVNVFGEKPTELRIVFPLEDEDRVASQYYRCYSKTRGLVCKGDGEKCLRLVDVTTGDAATNMADRDSKKVAMREMECRGRDCPDYDIKCKELMMLQFMLPEISGLGIWQIDTGSINSIRNINGALDTIRAVYGRISMVPLFLSLEKAEVIPPGGTKKTVYVLNIRSTDNLIAAAMKARMEPLALVAGITEEVTPDDVIDVQIADDERPSPTVVNDWEGPAGDPIDPKLAAIPVDASDLWPEDEQERMKPEEAAERMSPEEMAKATAQSEDEAPLDELTVALIDTTNISNDEPNEPEPANPLDFDPEELMNMLKSVKWTETTAKTWITSHLNVEVKKGAKLVDVLSELTREERETFFSNLSDRAQMM